MLAQGDDVVPIAGTKWRAYLDENAGAVDVELTAGELKAIDELTPRSAVAGERYAADRMSGLNR